jgi:hypothetical protein
MDNTSHQIPNLEVKTFKGNNYEIKSIEGTIHLPAWRGFQSRQGAYNSMDSKSQSDGIVKLMLGGDEAMDDPTVSAEQVKAYQYLVEHQYTIRDNILRALFNEYKRLQPIYGYEKGDPLMPDVTNVTQFKTLIGLSIVHLLNMSRDGVAYVGFEFGCTWDDEHGVGIMTHKNRVIEIGGADASFTAWMAEKDSSSEGAINLSEGEGGSKDDSNGLDTQTDQKPWWKFW